jgi:hypothetical protein
MLVEGVQEVFIRHTDQILSVVSVVVVHLSVTPDNLVLMDWVVVAPALVIILTEQLEVVGWLL